MRLPFTAIAAVAIAACLVVSSCAPTSAYVTAQHIKQGAAATLDAAYAIWRAGDHAAQQAILDGATSVVDFKTKIATYREIQSKVDGAFATARDAEKTLSDALAAAGAAKRNDFAVEEAKAWAALTDLAAILEKYGFKVSLPPVPTARLEVAHAATR